MSTSADGTLRVWDMAMAHQSFPRVQKGTVAGAGYPDGPGAAAVPPSLLTPPLLDISGPASLRASVLRAHSAAAPTKSSVIGLSSLSLNSTLTAALTLGTDSTVHVWDLMADPERESYAPPYLSAPPPLGVGSGASCAGHEALRALRTYSWPADMQALGMCASPDLSSVAMLCKVGKSKQQAWVW